MYRKASRMKIRFATAKGNLTVEDLWELSLPALDKIAIALDEELSKSPKKSFISASTPGNEILEVKFNIVKDIIETKLLEKKEVDEVKKKHAEKQRLLEVLSKKEEESLENLSVEELKERIAKLG